MTVSLNYASTALTDELDDQFESALHVARTAVSGPLPHIVDGTKRFEGAEFERRDPADPSRVVARAHHAPRAVVDDAVAAARVAQRQWRNLAYPERIELIRAAKAPITEALMELGASISAETGKPRLEALAEAQESVDLIEHYCSQLESNDGFVTQLRSTESDATVDVLRPYGVFGVLAPFNFPVALAINMTVAAIVTGNSVVLKPSDKTPRSTALVIDLLNTSLPTGVVNLVHGGAETGQIIAAADVDGLAFTGSAEVGWQLIRRLSSGPFGKPVLAEMGGHNPAIVTSSADLDDAVEGIVRSAFGFSGQKCSALRRVVVDSSVHDQLVERLTERVSALVVGDPAQRDSFVGPVIDENIADRVRATVAQARDAGATVVSPRIAELPGHYVAPTLIHGLPQNHPITRVELFAPVVSVISVDGFDEAIIEANAVDYGLSAGIFTAEESETARFLDEIQAGVVYVNRRSGATTGAWPGLQSFCGWKASGSSGKGGLGPWYLQGFMREQNRTISGESSR